MLFAAPNRESLGRKQEILTYGEPRTLKRKSLMTEPTDHRNRDQDDPSYEQAVQDQLLINAITNAISNSWKRLRASPRGVRARYPGTREPFDVSPGTRATAATGKPGGGREAERTPGKEQTRG